MSLEHRDVGHQDVVSSVAFSADGKSLISGSYDGTAKLWDIESGSVRRTFDCCDVQDVAFSPNGRLVAVAGFGLSTDVSDVSGTEADDRIGLFDVETGSPWRCLEEVCCSFTFAPSGWQFVGLGWDGVVAWDTDSGRELWRHYDELHYLRTACYSTDGCRIACFGSEGVVILDAGTGECLQDLTDPWRFEEDQMTALIQTFHLGEEAALEKACRNLLRFWDTHLGGFRPIVATDARDGNVFAAFSPNRSRMVLIGEIPPHLFHLNQRKPIRSLVTCQGDSVRTVAFSPDGKLLATGGDRQLVRIFSAETGQHMKDLGTPPSRITAIDTSPAGDLVAAGSADGRVCLWSLSERDLTAILEPRDRFVVTLAFAPDGTELAIGYHDGVVCFDRVEGDGEGWTIQAHAEKLVGGIYLPDGRTFATFGYDDASRAYCERSGAVRFWSIPRRELLQSIPIPPTLVFRRAAWSAKGRRVAFIESRGVAVTTFDDRPRVQPPIWQKNVYAIAFAPDGVTLAIAGEGCGMRLVNTETEQTTKRLEAARDGPTSIAFSPDGRWLARATAYDQVIELFDVSSGEVKNYCLGHRNSVACLAYAPDGSYLASGSRDGTVRIWKSPEGTLQATMLLVPASASGKAEVQYDFTVPE